MNKVLSVLVTSFLFLNLLVILNTSDVGQGKFVNNLGNPNDGEGRIITLDGVGDEFFDATTYFDMPLGQGSVLDAEFNITVLGSENNYPLNPTINVGLDQDIEWEFSGTGYGSMGHQEYFNDGTSKHTISFTSPSPSPDSSSVVKIPKNAVATEADLTIKGRFSQPDFTKFDYPTDRGIDTPKYVVMGDINNDGWNDAIITSVNLNKVIWFENDGTPKDSEWQGTDITSSLRSAWALAAADIDNDNDLDIVATSDDPITNFGIFWYENVNATDNMQPGNGSSWSAHRIDSVVNYTHDPESVRVADLDNDGDNDTIVGSNDGNNGGVYWFENKDGKGTSWQEYTIYHVNSPNPSVTDIAVGNLNHTNPGRLDVVATLYNQNDVAWFANDGDPTNTNGNWNRYDIIYRSYPWCIEIADMNSDGKSDVVVGYRQSNGVYWYKAPNDVINATSWTGYGVYPWMWYVADLAVGDMNKDSFLDVVVTSESWDDIYFCKNNNAAGTSFSRYTIDYYFNGPYGIAIDNVDKDGTGPDVIVNGYYSSEVRWYRNTGSYSNWQIYSIEEKSLNGPQAVFVKDIDHDGDNDTVVLGNSGGDLIWMEAPDDPMNTSQTWVTHVIENFLSNIWDLFVGDINGDGWEDVAVTSQYPSNQVAWYENPRNPDTVFRKWNKTVVDSYLYYAWGIQIADIDGDGDNDIVATGRYANDVIWYENNNIAGPGTGDGSSWTRFFIDPNFSYASGLWVEDMDSDDDLDVVVGSAQWSSGTGIVWFEAPADPRGSWTKHTIDTSPRYIYDVMCADINHDGRPDVVAGTFYDRFLHWYKAPVDPINGVWEAHTIWSSPNNYLYSYNLWIDDIGNDGYYDIVLSRDMYNQIWWFEAPDEPEKIDNWNLYSVETSLSGTRGVFIADIDDDGVQDVIGTGFNQNQVRWYKVDIKYPENVNLKVGNTEIFNQAGILDTNILQSGDFAPAINTYLSANQGSSYPDQFGNEFIDLKITTASAKAGRISLGDIEIVYDYTATIRMKPEGDGLASEITDLIPQGKNGTHRIYIAITSETPCQVKISDLKLEYNGAPEVMDIPNRELDEDTINHYLYDLRKYFLDDYQTPDDLYYGIRNWTNSDFVKMRIYNKFFLSVNCSKDPNTNWHGISEVVVYAKDVSHQDEIYTYSKSITVTVKPVDDVPVMKNEIPDIKVLMNTTNLDIDLDNSKKPYFVDIDSPILYYYYQMDKEFDDNISLEITPDNILKVTAIGGPRKNITVRVYCDDEPITKSKLDLITLYQEFEVEVVEIIDEEELKKPRWKVMPDCSIVEDSPGVNDWIHLPNFVNDYDNDPETLEYSIISISNNGYLEVAIDNQNNIDIIPYSNFDGTSEVVLRVVDPNGNAALGSFYIFFIPVNDKPIIEFREPLPNMVVSNNVWLRGFGEDIEGLDIDVQLKIGSNTPENPWLDIQNVDGYWSYLFDTIDYTERSTVILTCRAFDGTLYSENVSMEVIVDNTLRDSDKDGVPDKDDKFPFDEKEWLDSDEDGVGDNTDAFDDDATQWSDIDSDGYGDNPTGKGSDIFPMDPTQSKDKDGDGYGDNLDGNDPDYYPHDPDHHTEGSKETGGAAKSIWENMNYTLLSLFVLIMVLIIINVYLFTYVYLARSGKLAKLRAAKAEKRRKDEEALKKWHDYQQKQAKAASDAKAKTTEELKEMSTLPPMKPIVYYSTGPGPVTTISGGSSGMVTPSSIVVQTPTQTPAPSMGKRTPKGKDKKKVRSKNLINYNKGYGLYGVQPSMGAPMSPSPAPPMPFVPLTNPGYQPPAPPTMPMPMPMPMMQPNPMLQPPINQKKRA